MTKPSNRERLLTEGLRLVHERGFGAASVRNIVQAAGVPQGSFTNHFRSKEAFGLEVLERYYAGTRELFRSTLADPSKTPLDRLRAYVRYQRLLFEANDMRRGCLYGNFTVETTDPDDPLRRRVVEILTETERALEECILAAVEAGELPSEADAAAIANFVLSSVQGSTLLAKAQGSSLPFERMEKILFESVLRVTT